METINKNNLNNIKNKLFNKEKITQTEAIQLYSNTPFIELISLANEYREFLHKDITFYNYNLHLNTTNICEANCSFCSFARLKKGMPLAYTMTIQQAHQWIEERYSKGMTEIHIVNGLNPDLPFEYYIDLLQMIKKHFPSLHIKAFTAVEIHYFSEKFNMTYEEILKKLINAGLNSLPGGGAEIFSPRARKKLCKDKATASQWLKVHQIAHQLGLKSNCTMLYGTIERPEEIIEHLLMLRDQQEQTKGFQCFIPLAFHNTGNRLQRLPEPTGIDDLKIIALSRIILNNIPHIKAYWIMLGIKTAQIAQHCGANDFDGTVTEEKIYHMAGSDTPNALTKEKIEYIIQAANRIPKERDSLYNIINKDNANYQIKKKAV